VLFHSSTTCSMLGAQAQYESSIGPLDSGDSPDEQPASRTAARTNGDRITRPHFASSRLAEGL
jgi:hypothetical protein